MFDADYPEAGYPLYRCSVVAEGTPALPYPRRPDEPLVFMGKIVSDVPRDRWGQRLTVRLDETGVNISWYPGLHAYLDFDQAVAARAGIVDDFIGRIRQAVPESAAAPVSPLEEATQFAADPGTAP